MATDGTRQPNTSMMRRLSPVQAVQAVQAAYSRSIRLARGGPGSNKASLVCMTELEQ